MCQTIHSIIQYITRDHQILERRLPSIVDSFFLRTAFVILLLKTDTRETNVIERGAPLPDYRVEAVNMSLGKHSGSAKLRQPEQHSERIIVLDELARYCTHMSKIGRVK